MIGIFHIRNLQPRLPFFSRNTRFRRISRYKFLLSAKDLCHQFFKIPFSGILSCIQRTPIKADSPSQKVVGTPIRTVLGPEILFAPVRIITAATDTSYMGQIRPEDRIAVTTCVERIGTKSLTLLQRIVADDGTVRSQSRSVMVAFDFEAQQSVPVPDAWRRALEAE